MTSGRFLFAVGTAGALAALLGSFEAVAVCLDHLGFSGAGAPNSPSTGFTGAGSPGAGGAGSGTGEGSGPAPGTHAPDDPDYGPLDRILDALISALSALPGLSLGLPALQSGPLLHEGIEGAREGHRRREEWLDIVRRERELRSQFQD